MADCSSELCTQTCTRQTQVNEVKDVMVENIEKVLERGERIELLVDKTDDLRSQVRSLWLLVWFALNSHAERRMVV